MKQSLHAVFFQGWKRICCLGTPDDTSLQNLRESNHISPELIIIQSGKTSNLSWINITGSRYAKRCKGPVLWGMVCFLCASSRMREEITTGRLVRGSIDLLGTPSNSDCSWDDNYYLTVCFCNEIYCLLPLA
jgi:hypothetical protein